MQLEQEPTVGIDNAASSNTRHRAELLLSQLGRRIRVLDDPIEWLTTDASRPILMAIPQRTSKEVAAALRAYPDAVIVGIRDHPTEASLTREYLRAGVAGIIPIHKTPGDLIHALAAMLDGYVVADRTVLLNMVMRIDESPPPIHLSARDMQLLNLIAQGASIDHIAAATGYSQRHLRRITTELLDIVGATNRAHAAALAVQWELVSDIRPSGTVRNSV